MSENERNVSKSKPFTIKYILFNDILSEVEFFFFFNNATYDSVMTDGQWLKLCHLSDSDDLKTHI